MSRKRWVTGLVVAASISALDQASKWLMVAVVMDPPRLLPVTPFFNLTLGFNTGVSFGMLAGGRPWLLVLLATAIVALLLYWLKRASSTLEATALSAIIGGALGNVIDRLRLGGVVDFLDLHVAGWHWPAFNLADAAITVGVSLLVLLSLTVGQGQPARHASRG